MENRKLKRMVVGALLAAVYAVLALVLPMASFGPVQFRFSEALTLLPVFSPVAGIGVTLGCLITNLIGFLMGATFPQDILFGTLATLLGCVLTWLFRGVRVKGLPVLSALAPWSATPLSSDGRSTLSSWTPLPGPALSPPPSGWGWGRPPPAWCWACCWCPCWSVPAWTGCSENCNILILVPFIRKEARNCRAFSFLCQFSRIRSYFVEKSFARFFSFPRNNCNFLIVTI